MVASVKIPSARNCHASRPVASCQLRVEACQQRPRAPPVATSHSGRGTLAGGPGHEDLKALARGAFKVSCAGPSLAGPCVLGGSAPSWPGLRLLGRPPLHRLFGPDDLVPVLMVAVTVTGRSCSRA